MTMTMCCPRCSDSQKQQEVKKQWALQGNRDKAEGPLELLALVMVTDRAKKEEMEKGPPDLVRLTQRPGAAPRHGGSLGHKGRI